jgi:hypothetical protein
MNRKQPIVGVCGGRPSGIVRVMDLQEAARTVLLISLGLLDTER